MGATGAWSTGCVRERSISSTGWLPGAPPPSRARGGNAPASAWPGATRFTMSMPPLEASDTGGFRQ